MSAGWAYSGGGAMRRADWHPLADADERNLGREMISRACANAISARFICR